jgi:glycerol-3-phosphate dehydrogenase
MAPPQIKNRCRVAVVGAGINGVMTAWSLRKRGCEVVVFERGEAMRETSSASTKLLHGGLRYLENGEFRLVREALSERAWWLAQAPHLCRPIEIILPVRTGIGRPRWKIGLGLRIYDLLAGHQGILPHRWMDREATLAAIPGLRKEGLRGAFSFWDGQMDDLALGCWAAQQARSAGVLLRERCEVQAVAADGSVRTPAGTETFDLVVNVAGPWAGELLARSGIPSSYRLDLVRGSHLVTSRPCERGILSEVAGERRIGCVLPWKGGTLVGTTEVRQADPNGARCSEEEERYIRAFHDSVLEDPLRDDELLGSFAGIRPLISGSADPGRATREYAIERRGSLVTVFGGKWTTARALGERVAREADRLNGR